MNIGCGAQGKASGDKGQGEGSRGAGGERFDNRGGRQLGGSHGRGNGRGGGE